MAKNNFGRFSEQRRAVLDLVAGSLTCHAGADSLNQRRQAHPTAEEIFNSARKKLPKISLGTVYRNLEQLEQLGFIHKIEYKKDFVRYDGIMEPHDHFICTVCDSVKNVYLPELDELTKKTEKSLGVKVGDYRLYMFGRCGKCL
jgi:Fur family peroxide stress response transcriptional regulator